MTHEMARALADAGYISVAEYIRLCEEHGWRPHARPTTH